ncbi:NAD(P)-dependent oxidoreductase [Pedobacter sp. HMWF019]|uniref:NAD-dependent epimerase/dehydratase family protein n=1 Tax=Pedobacter sp. HMWF019 TaxID=2056856 RepID=UPI000D3D9475|nr:NAD(P)-dependent oxidoreductase [Pedobacter sp. HMWF019]PTS96255.1 NAD(P)-dependent oxidoreductase [Pedobacter sp. HMWF019]
MRRVLITGVTGYLGASIAEKLITEGIDVIGLKRETSDIWRCIDFAKEIEWVNIDESGGWKSIIIDKLPTEIIHCAWIGVEAAERNNWVLQLKNVNFLSDLLEIAQSININKLIFVGSQAEYGNISGKITENEVPKACNAYGGTKLACLEILKAFCDPRQINWIWLRLFSVFGEKESENWLIPSVINKMQNEDEMDFTKGEQKYAYLYIKDFVEMMTSILSKKIISGIYNVSSDEVLPISMVVEQIRDLVNPEFKLNFGALPYRSFQPMHLEGDMSKLVAQIGRPRFTSFKEALRKTVSYYISK